MPRKEAETSAGAHAITRWLGVDASGRPHAAHPPGGPRRGRLAARLQRRTLELLLRRGRPAAAGLRDGRSAGRHRTPPAGLAQALTDFANESGGIDNITVALARVGDTHTVETPETKDTPDGSVHRRGLPERVPARRRDRRARDRSRHVPGRGPGGAETSATDAAEIIIIDTSGSMGENGIAQGRAAATAALNEIIDGTWFAVIAGNHVGTLVFPYPGGPADGGWTPRRGRRRSRRCRRSGPTAGRPWAPGWPRRATCSRRCRRPPSGTRSSSPTAPTSTRPPTS